MPSFVTKKSVLNIILAVLLIVALVLGYLVYQKFVPTTLSIGGSSNGGEQSTQQPTAEDLEYAAMGDAELVRVMPNTGEASDAAFQAYSVQLSERTTATNQITIAENCAADPMIATVALGNTLTFNNESGTAQKIVLTPERSVSIAVDQSNSTVIDFETGQGVYGYSCDGQQVLAGILLVQ